MFFLVYLIKENWQINWTTNTISSRDQSDQLIQFTVMIHWTNLPSFLPFIIRTVFYVRHKLNIFLTSENVFYDSWDNNHSLYLLLAMPMETASPFGYRFYAYWLSQFRSVRSETFHSPKFSFLITLLLSNIIFCTSYLLILVKLLVALKYSLNAYQFDTSSSKLTEWR